MFEPVEERFVAAAERQLGKGFPARYREWLIACNGGEVEQAATRMVLYLSCVSRPGHGSMLRAQSSARQH